MAIRMRRGNEADFDPSKMLPGEWAVSTDTKYVRMCFSPGIVLRMATYEAFESDMAEIRNILSQCQNIQTAVELIQQNVTASELVIENYVKEAKQYRDEAEQFRNEAFSTTPEGYEDLVKNVSDNTVKIDTIIEKAELNIKNNAKGSNIHLTDSAESNVVALELYGKTEQNAYTGKNLLDCSGLTETTTNGVTFTPVYDGNGSLKYINANGTASAEIQYNKIISGIPIADKNTYLFNGANGGSVDTYTMTIFDANLQSATVSNGETVYWRFDTEIVRFRITISSGVTMNNVKFYPMISLEGGEYEPYVGCKPSPNPSYPQEIKSVKGKNLLDCRGLTETTINGITFTPVYDENGNLLYVNAKGVSTNAYFKLGTVIYSYECVLNGCPIGHSNTSAMLFAQTVDGSKTYYDVGNGIKIPANTEMNIFVRIASGYTANNLKFYPMIRSASIKDDTYVPYGLLRIKTQSKNLFDCSKLVETTKNNVTFTPIYENGMLQYINVNGTASAGTSYGLGDFRLEGEFIASNLGGSYFKKSDGTWIKTISDDERINIPIGSGYFLQALIFIQANKVCDNLKYYPMISKEGGEYEPYQSSEITLSKPIELNGLNGVYDVVTSDGVTRRFAKVVFDGSDDENWQKHTTRENVYFIVKSDKKANKKCLCTHYTDMQNANFDTYDYSMWNSGDFMIKDKDCSTLAEWKAKLQSNPMTVVYELATPTTEALQSDFTALKTFYPETHVSNDADCDMSITYTADAKNYIDNKIALLTTAIYNNI